MRFVGCHRTNCQASAKLALSIADLQVGVMAWWVGGRWFLKTQIFRIDLGEYA